MFKNKLHQQKAWANGATAAATQAHLIALTHNLLTLLLVTLERTGLSEKKIERVPAQAMVRFAAQLTCQFIRLVRHCLDYKVPWRVALPLFQRRLDSYL